MSKFLLLVGVCVVMLFPIHWFAINARSIVSGSIGERHWMADSELKIHSLNSKIDMLRIHVDAMEEKIDKLNKEGK